MRTAVSYNWKEVYILIKKKNHIHTQKKPKVLEKLKRNMWLGRDRRQKEEHQTEAK